MVEKIIINPNKVRGYGNIMSPHSSSDYELEDCTIATGTDTVNGATETVYTLTSTASHSYSLSFGSASYTAVGGACTVTVTLTDGGVAVNNATISVTGGTGGSGSGTTNSSGVASINVTGITASGTLTASFQSATATASVTLSTIPYQTVEYLQSNGSQYINTGYTLQSGDKVEVTVSMQGSGQYNGVFGARKGSSSTQCYALFGRFGSSNKFVYARTGNEKQGSTITTDTVYDVTTQNATCTINQNGTTVETLTSTGTINNCANPCGLFVLNTDSGTGFTKDTYGYMKIYSFKITNSSNEVVMDLVPVRDGTTGYMYDKVSGNLMNNNGTFLYGDDVSPSPSPTPTSYSLAFSQDTYTLDMFGETNVSCTLKNGNTPMSGQTITFSWEGLFGPQSATATTNSSGVAVLPFSDSSFSSLPATVTATYSGATATCTIESGGGGGGII